MPSESRSVFMSIPRQSGRTASRWRLDQRGSPARSPPFLSNSPLPADRGTTSRGPKKCSRICNSPCTRWARRLAAQQRPSLPPAPPAGPRRALRHRDHRCSRRELRALQLLEHEGGDVLARDRRFNCLAPAWLQELEQAGFRCAKGPARIDLISMKEVSDAISRNASARRLADLP